MLWPQTSPFCDILVHFQFFLVLKNCPAKSENKSSTGRKKHGMRIFSAQAAMPCVLKKYGLRKYTIFETLNFGINTKYDQNIKTCESSISWATSFSSKRPWRDCEEVEVLING